MVSNADCAKYNNKHMDEYNFKKGLESFNYMHKAFWTYLGRQIEKKLKQSQYSTNDYVKTKSLTLFLCGVKYLYCTDTYTNHLYSHIRKFELL